MIDIQAKYRPHNPSPESQLHIMPSHGAREAKEWEHGGASPRLDRKREQRACPGEGNPDPYFYHFMTLDRGKGKLGTWVCAYCPHTRPNQAEAELPHTDLGLVELVDLRGG